MDIEEIVKKIINDKFGEEAIIEKHITTTNNHVFFIKHMDNKYVFKIYHSKNWPEDGKLLYINSLLEKNNISYPKVFEYTRKDQLLENGYVIEERIEGKSLLDNDFNIETGKDIYYELAKSIKKVHQIKFSKYAYINNGNPVYDSLFEYIKDTLEDNLDIISKTNIINCNQYEVVEKIEKKLALLNLEPVLCHGDLSTRNAILSEGKITFIDWDDAMALPWECDVARLTFDMKFMHGDKYELFKEAFFKGYGQNVKEFNIFENVYHIFVGVDILAYLVRRNKLKDTDKDMIDYIQELIDKK